MTLSSEVSGWTRLLKRRFEDVEILDRFHPQRPAYCDGSRDCPYRAHLLYYTRVPFEFVLSATAPLHESKFLGLGVGTCVVVECLTVFGVVIPDEILKT